MQVYIILTVFFILLFYQGVYTAYTNFTYIHLVYCKCSVVNYSFKITYCLISITGISLLVQNRTIYVRCTQLLVHGVSREENRQMIYQIINPLIRMLKE